MPTVFPFQQDSLVLQPSKAVLILPLLLMLTMSAGGVWLIERGAPIGWWVVGIGAAGGLLALAQLLLNRVYVRLTLEGLTVGALVGAWHLNWSDIEWCDCTRRGIEIRYVSDRRVRKMAMMSDAYGMEPKEMARLLNQWRVRAARGIHG